MIYFMAKNMKTVLGTPSHIDSGAPPRSHLEDVCIVQADGDELEAAWDILAVPPASRPKRRVYTFVGDQAKTIFLNWQ
jgi:hypothetical protein